jgi:hypothetical protein
MRSRGRALLASYTTPHSFQFKTSILRRFHRAPERLAYKGRHLDAALFDIKDNSPAGWDGLGCDWRRWWWLTGHGHGFV